MSSMNRRTMLGSAAAALVGAGAALTQETPTKRFYDDRDRPRLGIYVVSVDYYRKFKRQLPASMPAGTHIDSISEEARFSTDEVLIRVSHPSMHGIAPGHHITAYTIDVDPKTQQRVWVGPRLSGGYIVPDRFVAELLKFKLPVTKELLT